MVWYGNKCNHIIRFINSNDNYNNEILKICNHDYINMNIKNEGMSLLTCTCTFTLKSTIQILPSINQYYSNNKPLLLMQLHVPCL